MTAFRLLLSLGLALTTSVGISSLQAKPLKVFILVGQSNMQGHAQIKTMEVGTHLDQDFLIWTNLSRGI